MLHYFPMKKKQNKKSLDSLCGWHLDHGGVTILLSAMYFDLEGNIVPRPEDAGLFIKSL